MSIPGTGEFRREDPGNNYLVYIDHIFYLHNHK